MSHTRGMETAPDVPFSSRLVQAYMPPDDDRHWVVWAYEDGSQAAPEVEVRSARLTWLLPYSAQDRAELAELVVTVIDPLTSVDREISCGLHSWQRKPPLWVQLLVFRLAEQGLSVGSAVTLAGAEKPEVQL
jgi:hypothetical protein